MTDTYRDQEYARLKRERKERKALATDLKITVDAIYADEVYRVKDMREVAEMLLNEAKQLYAIMLEEADSKENLIEHEAWEARKRENEAARLSYEKAVQRARERKNHA